MTIALVTLALTMAGLAGTCAYLSVRCVALASACEASVRSEQAERDARHDAELERDKALAKAEVAERSADTADRVMKAAQASAARAREELTKHVESSIVGATPAELARAVERLLATPLPGSANPAEPDRGVGAPRPAV